VPSTIMAALSVFRAGNNALITGGASGIGLALAKKCHQSGMGVCIVDINKDNLELAKKSVGERARTYEIDVGNLEDWNKLKAKVNEDFGHIDLLSLNAGIGLRGAWTDPEYFHKIMHVNLFGVVNGISTFLPGMKASGSASNPSAIIITGSKQGITNPPGNPAYNASKAAVRSLAEGLSWELRPSGGFHVNTHLLVPGWVYTGLSGAKPGSLEGKPDGAWSGEQTIDYLVKKMEKGEFYVICPDNDVNEETDKRRMLWSAREIVDGRQPLMRWRDEESKAAATEWMNEANI